MADQLSGRPEDHAEVRKNVVQYMRDHKNEFEEAIVPDLFIRQSKRRKTFKYAYSNVDAVVTEDDCNRTFEKHLSKMAKDGIYGDEIEVRAFSMAYNMDVWRFQSDRSSYTRPVEDMGLTQRPVAYIAHHVIPLDRSQDLITDINFSQRTNTGVPSEILADLSLALQTSSLIHQPRIPRTGAQFGRTRSRPSCNACHI